MARKQASSEARQRILDTADRLFYQHGIRATGIDRIIAEAGAAKMTFYAHFPAKDDLVLAVLQQREKTVMAFFREAMERRRKRTKDPIRIFFGALEDYVARPEFRGCAFINASVELADPNHPGMAFVRGHKERFRAWLTSMIGTATGGAKTAAALALLVEGVIVTAVIQGSPAAAAIARDAALQLVAACRSRLPSGTS